MDNLKNKLRRHDAVPNALYSCAACELEAVLGGPSLFFLEGRQTTPLFVTVLQHGNEPTGFEAVQSILCKYRDQLLPRSMWLFVANVSGARKGLRVLDDQTDYNRSWPGTLHPLTPEAGLMREVVETVTCQPLFASVDLHNNTGNNPHYACLNELDPQFQHLAALFARTTIYYRQPVGTQSLAMAEYCPAVTLECGKAGEDAALDHAVEYLDACLHMQELPDHALAKGDIILLKTQATVKVKPGVDFGFEQGHDLQFRSDLDHFNFGILQAGEWLAKSNILDELPLTALIDSGEDIASELFAVRNGHLIARVDIMPSMATLDTDIVRQDCLFYVMLEFSVS